MWRVGTAQPDSAVRSLIPARLGGRVEASAVVASAAGWGGKQRLRGRAATGASVLRFYCPAAARPGEFRISAPSAGLVARWRVAVSRSSSGSGTGLWRCGRRRARSSSAAPLTAC